MSEAGKDNGTPNLAMLSPVRPRRLTSIVWEDFTRFVSKDGSMKASCNHCKRVFTGSSNSGTSHLRKHLQHCFKGLHGTKCQQVLPFASLVPNKCSGSTSNVKFDQDHSHQELAKMIILHQYPFQMVEDVGFLRFVKSLQPQFKMVTSNTIMDDCLAIFQKEKQRFDEFLKKMPGKMSLTSNMSTFKLGLGYMWLTAHFIGDDWKLHKRILNFKIFPMGRSINSESNLSHSIVTCILDWDIEKKLSTITLDNFYTYDAISKILRENFPEKNTVPLTGPLFCMSCCNNVLNIIVQDELSQIRDTVHKVRQSVEYIKASHVRQLEFDEIAKRVRVSSKKRLCLDNQSQWNSTYLMLEVALEFREAFSCLQTCDLIYKGAPSVDDWKKVEAICMLLKNFYDAKNILSESTSPTCNLSLHELSKIQTQLTQHCSDSDPFVRTMAQKMHGKFNEYWKTSSLVLAIAVVMDPRFKMKLVEYCFSKVYVDNAEAHIKLVREGICDLYNGYVKEYSSSVTDKGIINKIDAICDSDSDDELQEYDKFISEQFPGENQKSELDQYLDEPIFPRDQEFDILNWWKVNTPKYQLLSKMARDILAIPVASSELELRTRSKVLDKYHSSLLPETIEALVCAQDWLQNPLGGHLNEPEGVC